MRLSHPMFSEPIYWRQGRIPVLVLEHPRVFRNVVFELSAQAQGEEGDFALSLDYEPLDCGEHLHVLRDYAELSVDERKLQSRFQSYLQNMVREELAVQSDALQQEIVRFLEAVIMSAEYPITLPDGEYVSPLLKALKCQPVLDGADPLERLMQYIELYSGLLRISCFVLVGAHAYFSPEELRELYRMAGYEKWRFLMVEQQMRPPLPEEDIRLLDETMCELRLDGQKEMN